MLYFNSMSVEKRVGIREIIQMTLGIPEYIRGLVVAIINLPERFIKAETNRRERENQLIDDLTSQVGHRRTSDIEDELRRSLYTGK